MIRRALVRLGVVRLIDRVLRWICDYRLGHEYRLIIRDAGPLGSFAWWYCPRCRWSSPMRSLGRWGLPS